jgi:protein gp37
VNRTSIEWCIRPETRGADGARTWNPIRARLKSCFVCSHEHQLPTGICGYPGCKCTQHQVGTFCTRISPGCQHCYASSINKRFGNGLEFTVPNLEKIEFFLDERFLAQPVDQSKPCTIFVGDMFDLFHEAIPAEFIAEVLRVALKTPRHTYQFLTKRAERMRNLVAKAQEHWGVMFGSHMWFGVSVEDQPRADERISLLLQTPAAVRFLSVEPQLEEVGIRQLCNCGIDPKNDQFAPPEMHARFCPYRARIHWVICGGESGPGARPFNLAWAESLLAQCRAAGVPFFMKQIGSYPTGKGAPMFKSAVSRKGGDPSEWPPSLRVREFPTVRDREAVTA